jgi:serine/threonine protein kinase
MVSKIKASAIVGERYRIVRELASGSQATVYEGELLNLGKRVAIKFLARNASPRADAVSRFKREMRALAATASDHTVQVLDVGDDAELGLYMVMELLEGESLGAKLTREGRLSVDETVVIGIQTAWALENAHAAGIVHRDLKPDNLFLVKRDVPATSVKLLDFGVAKLNRGIASAITPFGITLGTPQYMSPEQVTATRDIDARTDIWSLGAVLFEMLAGRPAINDCDDITQLFTHICEEGPPKLGSVAPHVPARVARVIDAMLTRDRMQRVAEARTVAELLLDAAPESIAAAFMPQSKCLRAAAGARGRELPRRGVDFSAMDFDDLRGAPECLAHATPNAHVSACAAATAPSIVAHSRTGVGRPSARAMVLAPALAIITALGGWLGLELSRGAHAGPPTQSR